MFICGYVRKFFSTSRAAIKMEYGMRLEVELVLKPMWQFEKFQKNNMVSQKYNMFILFTQENIN